MSILQGESLDVGDSPAQSCDIPDAKINPEVQQLAQGHKESHGQRQN